MKIFASDYDGTFAKSGGDPSEVIDNIEQVEKWRKAGNVFVFATGRSVALMSRFTPKDLKYDYLVALNGALITNAANEELYKKIFSNEIAEEVMALIRQWGIKSFTVSDGFSGHHKIKLQDFTAAMNIGFPKKIIAGLLLTAHLVISFLTRDNRNISYQKAMSRPVAQITTVTSSYDKAVAFAELINERFKNELSAYVNLTSVDINYYGLSKATGLAYICEMLNAESSQMYCMGDSYNDIPMLEAYHGFTLPDAPEEIKAKAKGIHSTVGDALRALL